MRSISTLAIVVALAFNAAYAQPEVAAKKADPVLKVVPAGTLGFAVVNNVKATATSVDKYLTAIGADPLAKAAMPNGFLAFVKESAQLGDGFNAEGGMAVALLDPQQFGVDLMKVMKHESDQKLPVVFFVPASSVKDLFTKYKMEESGKLTKVELRMGPSFATKIGDYVVFGPLEKAVQAVVDGQSGKKADSELATAQTKLIADADFAFHVNMKVAGPIITGLMNQAAEEKSAGYKGPEQEMLDKILPMYKKMLPQIATITFAGQLAPTGTVIHELVGFVPDSPIGKAVASFKSPGTPLLNQLPGDMYVLAVGGVKMPSNAELVSMNNQAISSLLSMTGKKLPEGTEAKVEALCKQFNDETTSMQFVGGGAPEGSGLFGLTAVLSCKDADKMQSLLAEAVGVAQNIITSMGDKSEDAKNFTIKYTKGQETVGDKKVDVIDITFPELTKMEEDDRAKMKKVLGEDKLRIYVLPAAKDKVVLTFGGSMAYLTQAAKIASGATGGLSEKDAGDAVKFLPPENERVVLALFNPGNLFELVKQGAKTMNDGNEMPIPFTFNVKAPVVFSAGLSGNDEHVVFFVPNELVKQIVGIYMMMSGGGRGPGPGPMEGGESF